MRNKTMTKKKIKDLAILEVFKITDDSGIYTEFAKLGPNNYYSLESKRTIEINNKYTLEEEVEVLGKMVFMTDEDIENWYHGTQRSF